MAPRKGEEEESNSTNKKTKSHRLQLIFLTSLISLTLFLAPHYRFTSSEREMKQDIKISSIDASSQSHTNCSAVAGNSICCDRSSYHSDICFMHGDVRIHPPSSSVVLYSPSSKVNNKNSNSAGGQLEETIRPYTRKWEAAIMDQIGELRLRTTGPGEGPASCDVRHGVPALFFSAGGYTGNVFHAFNNGLLPLYITSQHLRGRVVLVVLEYRGWWHSKYREILSQISDYPPIDFSKENGTHCFPGAVAGLRFHGTLQVDPALLPDRKSIADFHRMLDEAYKPDARGLRRERSIARPKLVLMARNGTRVIENEGEVVRLAEEVGFDVEVVAPGDTMGMGRIYRSLSSCDVMMGVHGAALTHFLFMRPGSVLIQVVPVGIQKLAWACFGEAAVKMGLRYEAYKVLPRESSLFRELGEGDRVVKEPARVKGRGWQATKVVYLDGQNVTLDRSRLRPTLLRAFRDVVSARRG